MSTPLTDAINALTRYANETTGASDTTLSEAVNTLVEGFGKGGGVLWKSVTLEEDYILAVNGCIPQWTERLDIDEITDLDEYIYLYDFTENTEGNLYGNVLIVRQGSENNRLIISIRNGYTNVSTSEASNREFFATAGTVINIYRFKADDNEVKPDFIRLARSFETFFYNQKNLPQKIVLNPIQLDTNKTNREVFNGANEAGQNTATLDVTLILNQTTTFNLARFFWNANGVKKITIQGNLNLCKDYTNMLQALNNVEEINAVFDFSSCPYPSDSVGVLNSSTSGNKVLREMRFAPNTARVRIAIVGFEVLSDESLVSVANCLVEGIGQTLALHSSRKTRCSSIMGNNDNGTFVADENGTMTLEDFITNVKGWTLS